MDLKTTASLAFAYSLLLSACYLFAYWGPFDVNVLEQIAFTDLAKIAFYPVAAFVIFIVLGSITTQLFTVKLLPYGGGAIKKDGTQREWKLWYSGVLLVLSFVAYTFMPEPRSWIPVGFLAGLAAFPLVDNRALVRVIPNNSVRGLTPFFAIMILTQSIYIGRSDAYRVLSGNPEREVDPVRSGLPLYSGHFAPIAYLGLLGDTHFLYESMTGQVVSIRGNDDLKIFFKHDSHPSKMVRRAKRDLFERAQRNAKGSMPPSSQPLIMEGPQTHSRVPADKK